MLTLQQIFDQTLEKLNQAGRIRSVANSGKCAYRGSNGAKCAVGLWIPDHLYNGEWENTGILALAFIGDFVDAMAIVGINVAGQGAEAELLNALQKFHDNYLAEGSKHWWQIEELERIAVKYGLTFNPSQWEKQK